MKTNRNWYVIYTKQGSERKVADQLDKRKIENYCPTCTHVRDYNGKTKLISVSLFSTMIFVHTSVEELSSTIRNMDGVSGIMFWLQNPAIISAGEIDSIRQFVNTNENVQLEKNAVQSIDEKTAGSGQQSFKNDFNTFGIDGIKKLHLPSLGYSLTAPTSIARLKSVA